MIRFGQMTEDELFVTAEAAPGVRIENKATPIRSSSSSTSAPAIRTPNSCERCRQQLKIEI